MNYTKILDKVYKPDEVEDRLYLEWMSNGYFHADENSKKESYSIVIPTPNVTGKLTMGHVLNNTIQDILIRKARMEGKEVCWVPGTDHASIATETKIVKMLAEQGFKVELDLRNEKIGFKIREHTIQRVPYMLVIGDKELENNSVAVRTRSGEDLGSMSIEDLITRFSDEIACRGSAVLEE